MIRELGQDPRGFLDYVFGLQEELRQAREQTEQTQRELQEHKQKLAQAHALIAELKQQLYGAQSEKLTPEQEEQLERLVDDLQEEAQRTPPLTATPPIAITRKL